MKRRLLDLIACPHDRHFPLELKIGSTVDTESGPDRCELYCVTTQKDIEGERISEAACSACSRVDVTDGELYCPHCRSVFKIIHAIPSFLHEEVPGSPSEIEESKLNEMRARDSQAREYDLLKMLKVLSKLEIPRVIRFLKPGEKDLLVELGAGTGRITDQISRLASEVVAIDFSIKSLKRSQKNCSGKNVHWIHADINHLPLRDGVGDQAFSCQVFEHLPGATLRNMAIDEAARVIKDGGRFVISVYRDSWFWSLFGPKEGFHEGGIYYFRFTQDEFQDLVTRQFVVEALDPNVGMYLQMAKCVKPPAG